MPMEFYTRDYEIFIHSVQLFWMIIYVMMLLRLSINLHMSPWTVRLLGMCRGQGLHVSVPHVGKLDSDLLKRLNSPS